MGEPPVRPVECCFEWSTIRSLSLMGSEPSIARARPLIPQEPRTSMSTKQLAARLLEFDALVSSELRKSPADIIECSDDDVSDQGVCEPLVIGWNQIPRSM